MMLSDCRGWLPSGKRAAVCFSIDDIHPASSRDAFDAGGDLGSGALGRVQRLLARHPRLRITLFVTPNWRRVELLPTRRWVARVPLLRTRVHWAPLAPRGRFRIDRFPDFVAYLNALPRTDCAVHGLHHAHRGPRLAMEFQEQSQRKCRTLVRKARGIFVAAGLRHVAGFAAPAWNTPPALVAALSDEGFRFVASARDLDTPVSERARTAGDGLRGASLIQPTWVACASTRAAASGTAAAPRLLHFTTNFQATSPVARAHAIVEAGGLLFVKAHIFKTGGGITMLDGLDDNYCAYLERLWRELDRRYGDTLWWASLDEVTNRCRAMAA
jgi:predicted deacetylase